MLAVHTHIAGDTGIVHQQRQLRIFLVDLLGGTLNAVEVLQLNVHPSQHVDALSLQLAHGFLGTLLIACTNHYFPATQSEVLGYSKPNALIGTSY